MWTTIDKPETGEQVWIIERGGYVGPFTVVGLTGRTSDHVVLSGRYGRFEHYAPHNLFAPTDLPEGSLTMASLTVAECAPTCDVCGALGEDESVDWCGECGCCVEHCQRFVGCEVLA